MAEPEKRWPQFTLWSMFVLTAVMAVLAAACTGAFGEGIQIGSCAVFVALSTFMLFRCFEWGVTAMPPSGSGLVESLLFSLDAVFDEVVPLAV